MTKHPFAFLTTLPLNVTASYSPSSSCSPRPPPTHRLTPRCAEVFGPANKVEPTDVTSTDVSALPPYTVVTAPHLSEYLDDLPTYTSPLVQLRALKTFTRPAEVVLANISFDQQDHSLPNQVFTAFQKAGPRENIVFPAGVRAAIVSCGGICPGINTVIRELTTSLYQYGASTVFGVPHGYRGFYNGRWRHLSLADVEEAHKTGGSMLGSSRGGFDLQKIADAIETRQIDHVYVIGGDGTIMGCNKIYQEIRKRGLKTAVVSVPKTIDNDIAIIDRSFGFETAVDEAQRAIGAAYVEANAFPDCISVVKLMGRNSGFIACHAALASHETDCCLVPEEQFVLRGSGGVLEYVEKKLNEKGGCVLVVAEGAGNDVYGNVDIGRHIMDEVKAYFQEKNREISTKYLDPTYQNPGDTDNDTRQHLMHLDGACGCAWCLCWFHWVFEWTRERVERAASSALAGWNSEEDGYYGGHVATAATVDGTARLGDSEGLATPSLIVPNTHSIGYLYSF